MDSKCRLDFLEIEEEMYSIEGFRIARLKQDSHSTNSKWHRSFKVDVPYPLDSPRFARNTRGGRATKRFGVIKAIDPSRWLILLVATIRGIVFSLRKGRHDNRNIQEAAIVAASGVFFAPPPPLPLAVILRGALDYFLFKATEFVEPRVSPHDVQLPLFSNVFPSPPFLFPSFSYLSLG